MKTLTRIRLINWHLFENTTVSCHGTTYFIGVNGAGKSTILDAVQFALVGGQRDVKFNQAALSGGKRTLASYVRGVRASAFCAMTPPASWRWNFATPTRRSLRMAP
jgi:uncharacterized protein YPO0396